MDFIIKMLSPPFIPTNISDTIPSFRHQFYFLMANGQMTLVFDSMESLDFRQSNLLYILLLICFFGPRISKKNRTHHKFSTTILVLKLSLILYDVWMNFVDKDSKEKRKTLWRLLNFKQTTLLDVVYNTSQWLASICTFWMLDGIPFVSK